MTRTTAIVAAKIISQAGREHPADALLRGELSKNRALSPGLKKEISLLVFNYFRWKGWLTKGHSIADQLGEAETLARRYEKKPSEFKEAELFAKTVPGWLSAEFSPTVAWLQSLQARPKLWLRARPGQGRALAGKLGNARLFDTPASSDILEYLGEKDLFRTPEFHNGEFEIQDISSQAVGLLCNPQPGETWWDACAGQGGKALHLADLMSNKGLVWASDRAEWRLAILKRRAARAGLFNYRGRRWDGGERLPTRTLFHGVLVDAPCSGLGTWQRNPHARWTTSPEDVRTMAELQKKILMNASKAVKPGGKLVYSVCTVTRSETSEVMDAFAIRCPAFKPLPLNNPLKTDSRPQHGLLLAGDEFGGNSMFVAAWIR